VPGAICGQSLRNTGRMDICIAGQQDLAHLARLLWLHAAPDEQAKQSVESFAVDLAAWWTDHEDSHLAFVARLAESGVVCMAWLAFVPRVPRPGATTRRSADIQSVFVVPEQRGKRIGSALVQAASEHALRLGAGRVTVNSGRKAVPVYERLGFASSRQLLQRPAE
jgi:GNAT superfamily N-acetyltransferase